MAKDLHTDASFKKFNNTTYRTRYKASVLKSNCGNHSTSVCPTDSSCFKTSHKTKKLTSRHNGNISRKYDVTCEEFLHKWQAQHKGWISFDTMKKLEVRKEKKAERNTSRTISAKAKAQEDITTIDKEVKEC